MQGDYATQGSARPRGADCSDRSAGAPARFFLCARCRAQVLICSHCDRGHIYCGKGCATEARRRSLREAGRRYQASRRGRLNHAERSRRYRACKNNVTHQGSPPDQMDDVLFGSPAVSAREEAPMDSRPRGHCRRCGRPCPPLMRRDFLRRRVHRNNRRGSDYDHSP